MTSRSIFPPNCGRIFFSCSRNPIMGPHWKWQRNISMVSDDSPFVAIRNCSFCGFSGDASNLQVQIKVSMTTNAPCDSLLISIPWLSPGSISLPFRSAGKTLRTMRNYPEAVWNLILINIPSPPCMQLTPGLEIGCNSVSLVNLIKAVQNQLSHKMSVLAYRVFTDYRYRPGVELSCPLEKFLILWKIHWKVRNELSRNEPFHYLWQSLHETHRDRGWLCDNTGEFQINNGLLILATWQSCCSFVIPYTQKWTQWD